VIHSSRRSLTSSAIRPSPKLSWRRLISITAFPPGCRSRFIRTEQILVDLADPFDRSFQALIIGQPAAHQRNHLAAQAQLPRASAGVADREDRQPVAFTAPALGAIAGLIPDASLHP